MKRILTIILTAACLAGCDAKFTEFWSVASYATIEAITGNYTLYFGTWSSEIDLSGEGFVTDDILYQMELYGWTGIQSIRQEDDPESVTVLQRSLVITPEKPEYITQINLYVPYPEYGNEQTEKNIEKAGRCNISMEPYQFHYKVDSRGDIEILSYSISMTVRWWDTEENLRMLTYASKENISTSKLKPHYTTGQLRHGRTEQ